MMHILHAEDQESNRITLTALLEEEGFRVTEAASAGEARARLAEGQSYDLVLLDLNLGDGLGTELVPLVRERHPAARVILLTGNLTDAVPAVDAVLPKGSTFPELLELIRRTVGGNP